MGLNEGQGQPQDQPQGHPSISHLITKHKDSVIEANANWGTCFNLPDINGGLTTI